MIKHTMRILCCISLLFCSTKILAQGPVIIPGPDTNKFHSCGLTPEYFLAQQVPSPHTGATASLTHPLLFPTAGVDTCGKIIVYYEDARLSLATGIARGFAESGGVGTTRRNTMCQVLTYFQSVIDFSKIPAGEYIRFHIDTSYGMGRLAKVDNFSTPGRAAPYCDTFRFTGDSIVNGFVFDFLNTGIDPNAGDYHANIRMNFDSLDRNESTLNQRPNYSRKIVFNNGTGPTSNCELDLYSWLLHMVTHASGFIGLQTSDTWHTGVKYSRYYTNLDSNMRFGADIHTAPDPFATLYTPRYAIPSGYGASLWLNNRRTPDNAPVHYLDRSHFNQYDYVNGHRVANGDYQTQNVMGYYIFWGETKRTFGKLDLMAITGGMKLPLKPSFVITNDTLLNNHAPWSSRMASLNYSQIFDSKSFAEAVPADYTVTNDSNAIVTISLVGDTTIKDLDGDDVTFISSSIFNLRGCGQGGNNHNLLTLSADKKSITFRPRNNFYGRAQFGVNITDSKEKGGFVLYTIEVNKGNNVSLPPDSNYVLNGDFEEGSEVKIMDTAQDVNNGIFAQYAYFSGRITLGMHFSDAHPYDCYTTLRWGTAIRNSFTECNSNNKKFGYAFGSFPFHGAFLGFRGEGEPKPVDSFPEAYKGKGNRYQPVGLGGILLNLADSLRKCHRYVLELDIRHTYPQFPADTSGYGYPLVDDISLGFTQNHFINDGSLSFYGHMLQQLNPAPIGTLTNTKWDHVSIPFTYCSDTPSNLLHINSSSASYNPQTMATLFIDNVVLKEQPLEKSLAAADSNVGSCSKRLFATIPNFGCPRISYTWTTTGGTLVDTGASILVSPLDTTDYIVTAYDGCQSAKDTIRVAACGCGPGAFFGTGKYTRLSGTVSSLGTGNYYIGSDITISGTPTWTGANVLIASGVTITVGSSSLLTIDSSHLFTCPTAKEMWRGIVLSSSGRISVQRNALVEDALTAISASSPSRPGSGYIMDIQNSTFNRNVTAISIENYTYATDIVYPFRFRGNVITSRNLGKDTIAYPLRWPLTKVLRGRYKNPYTGLPLPGINLDTAYVYTPLKTGSIPYAAFRLNNIGYTNAGSSTYYGITIGDRTDSVYRNIIDYMADGIYSRNVNLTLYNNMFIQSHKPNPATLPSGLPVPMGIGVRTQVSDGKKYKLYMSGQPRTAGNDDHDIRNMFYDCDKGIDVVSYWDTRILNSQMQSSNAYPSQAKASIGINAQLGSYGYCYIDTNWITNIPSGIILFLNTTSPGSSYGEARIYKNKLYRNDWIASLGYSGAYIKQGISVSASVFGVPAAASGNIIKVDGNYMSDVYNGINVSYCQVQPVQTTGNTIVLTDESGGPAQYAISYLSNNNGLVQSNTLAGNVTLMNTIKVRGVYAAYNTGLLVCSNSSNQLGSSFDFSQISPQAGTRWLSNTMSSYTNGFVLGSPIGDQTKVSYYRWPGTLYVSTTYPTGNIWNGTSVPGAAETNALIPSSTSQMYVRTAPGQMPSINRGTFTNRYTVGTTLFTSTNGTPACSQNIDPVVITTSTTTSTTIAGGIGSLLGPVKMFIADHGLLRASLVNPGIADSSIQYRDFVVAADNSRMGWLNHIETALSVGDVATAENLINSQPQGIGQSAIDTDIVVYDVPDADPIIALYSNFYGLYGKFLQETFDSADNEQLRTLTLLCPSENGSLVYQARNLYAQLNDTVIVYDDDACMPPSEDPFAKKSLSETVQQQQYSLYPNPNDGNLNLRQNLADNEPVQAIVSDMTGKVILRKTLQFTGGSTGLRLGEVARGIYLLQLSDNKGRNFTMKFTIK